jgi:hypothetical protein
LKVENRNGLPLPSAPTDGDDFLGVIEIDTVNVHGDTKDLRDERHREVLLEHRQEADALFRVKAGTGAR